MDKHMAESIVQDLMTASKYIDYTIKGACISSKSQELVNELTLLQISLGDISNRINQLVKEKRKEVIK